MNYAAPLSRLARSRVRTPCFTRGRRNPFNLRAFCVAQRGEIHGNPLVSIVSNAN